MRRLPRFLVALPLTLAACGDIESPDPDPDPDPDPTYTYSWHQDVAPIIHEHCLDCHVAGGIGPFELVTYDDAKPVSGLIQYMTEAREMPPWSAEDGDDCAPRHGWVKDPRLTDDEIEILRVWHEEGAPEGDPDDPAPLPTPDPRELSGVTHTIEMTQPYVTSGFADELVCVVIDPELAQANWLTGFEVKPGDLQVVHHVVMSVVPPAARAEVEAQIGPDGTFECFGGVGVEGVYPLGVWVPGSDPFETPEGIGVPIPAGSAILMQMHYHPTGGDVPDQTSADLRLTSTFPGGNFTFIAAGNAGSAPLLLDGPNDRGFAEFRIPAGIADHTESMVFPIDTEATRRFPIFAAFPHMHYVGTKLKVTIERQTPAPDEPAEECLVNVNRWDFDWQRTYQYDADLEDLPTIGDGDLIRVECEYDNSMNNPFVVRALEEQGLSQPVDVYLGEETLDEMCLGVFGVIF